MEKPVILKLIESLEKQVNSSDFHRSGTLRFMSALKNEFRTHGYVDLFEHLDLNKFDIPNHYSDEVITEAALRFAALVIKFHNTIAYKFGEDFARKSMSNVTLKEE